MHILSKNTLQITRRAKYEKMIGKEMFPHLLTWNPPNLVEIKQKQNKLQIFIDNPLS